MLKRGLVIGILLAMVLIAGIWAGDEKEDKVKADNETVLNGNRAFVLDLYAQLSNQEGNLFFSPYSISTALAMTYAGARGETEKQMAKTLHFDLPQEQLHSAFSRIISNLTKDKKGYQISVANALWGQKDYEFLKSFLDLTNTSYGAGFKEIDFKNATEKARKTINSWVEKETKDKIKDLIQQGVLNDLTRLVLTNAIYFKGDWVIKFDKKLTKDAPFTLIKGDKVNVTMMHQAEEQKFKYTKGEGFQTLELPYIGSDLSMVIFLPDKVDGINDFEKSLTLENLTKWLVSLHKDDVIVSIPKFKMTCGIQLKNILSAMGMTDAFSETSADFSGITGKKDLFISAVIHKAFVDVNEEGTEAAAATAVGMAGNCVRKINRFNADHPFIFVIRDMKSNSILFMGRVMNPKE